MLRELMSMRKPFLALLVLGMTAPALAGAPAAEPAVSPQRGKLLFLQCGACHAVQAGAPHGVGPNLSGILGRRSGTITGFASYSAALRNAALTWDDATMDRWLENPSALVPGNNMAFVGLPRPADRQAIINYLKSLTPAAAQK